MANWAWPHTPASNWARLVLAGGPFNGERAGFLPPDVAAPVQIAWSGWFPWGPTCYLYRHEQGDVQYERGRVAALVYRPTGIRVRQESIPPVVAQDAEMYADSADMIAAAFNVPRKMIWPGL